jgi:hypothetical protein
MDKQRSSLTRVAARHADRLTRILRNQLVNGIVFSRPCRQASFA